MGEPGEYRKLRVPTYAPRLVRETAEGKYWRRFRSPKLFQQVAGVTYVDVCPTAPHYFAATSSTRVRRLRAPHSRQRRGFQPPPPAVPARRRRRLTYRTARCCSTTRPALVG
jgi:hypothetical protein